MRFSSLAAVFYRSPPHGEDGLNLRVGFGVFLVYLAVLAGLAKAGLSWSGADSGNGLLVWVLGGSMFYLSLCCTFFPAPTTWIVMLLASDYLAQTVGLEGMWIARVVVVATLCALATGAANLNEYHILTFLLRYRRAAAVRQTRMYRLARRWFAVSPFWVLVLFSLIPIPVDVVRWLAVACRYSRWRYFVAYFVGRWVRYALLAVSAIGFVLAPWHIAVIQLVLIAAAAARLAPAIHRRLQRRPGRRRADV